MKYLFFFLILKEAILLSINLEHHDILVKDKEASKFLPRDEMVRRDPRDYLEDDRGQVCRECQGRSRNDVAHGRVVCWEKNLCKKVDSTLFKCNKG